MPNTGGKSPAPVDFASLPLVVFIHGAQMAASSSFPAAVTP